ncbi:MAG TPA: VWA-like domain-containing protein [Saprospiraceae bacterium]|nr:VWA-like domain-containing protein [Saprospiraceae bacterium]
MTELAPIEKVCIQLLLKAPFYGHFLMGIPKSFDEHVETACVSLYRRNMIQLKINPAFWAALSEDHKLGLIQHEVLHIALRHLNRVTAFTHRRLFNIAADLVVNQYIEPPLLPPDSILPEQLLPWEPILGYRIEKEQGIDYYYAILLDILQKIPLLAPGNGMAKDAAEGLPSWLQDDNKAMRRHVLWDEITRLDSSEERILEQFVRNASRQALDRTRHKPSGRLPAALREMVEHIHLEPPRVNWRRTLRLFAASGTSTWLKSTIRKPSKRYGTVPGIKLNRHHRLAIVLDTSGSIRTDEMRLFFSEVWQIWRRGAQITIIECDAKIQNVYPYAGSTPDAVSGRGGTRFDEPLRWANEHLPDALIYFTDGHAPPPQTALRRPVLWVITPQGKEDVSHLPGRVLRMV